MRVAARVVVRRTQAEALCEGRTVDRNVVVTRIAAPEGTAVSSLRRQARKVRNRTAHGRQYVELAVVDVRGYAGPVGVEDRTACSGDHDFIQVGRFDGQRDVEYIIITQRDVDAFIEYGLETEHRDFYRVGTARTHVHDAVIAGTVHNGGILGA